MRFAVLVLSAALVAAPAFAQTEPSPIPPSPTAAETTEAPPTAAQGETGENVAEGNDGSEQICRTVQRTESRLRNRRERICATRAQWEQMSRDAQNDAQRAGMTRRVDN